MAPNGAKAQIPAATAPPYSCVRNFYVSAQTGNDANTGAQGTPWRTIQHANDFGKLTAGDCVNVLPGVYSETPVLTVGGGANYATGYVTYRASAPLAAKITPVPGTKAGSVVRLMANYLVIDGFEIDGGNAGLSAQSVPNSSGHCIDGTAIINTTNNTAAHHLTAINNMPHDCGGGGIELAYGDWYTVKSNLAYNNAKFSVYQTSGISIYEARAVTFTATAADVQALFHSVVANNIAHDNNEAFVNCSASNPTCHSDGNGIIIDDLHNSQATNGVAYPYATLVQSNLSYNNGGKGIQVYLSDNVTVANNTVYGNNTDLLIYGTWRGDLNNSLGSNNIWVNNLTWTQVGATGSMSQANSAVNDGSTSTYTDANVQWLNNLTYIGVAGSAGVVINQSGKVATFLAQNLAGENPVLVVPGVDFHLAAGSPAIGAGRATPTYPPTSLDGTAMASVPNIGAF